MESIADEGYNRLRTSMIAEIDNPEMGKAICIRIPSTEEDPDLQRLMLNGNVVFFKIYKFYQEHIYNEYYIKVQNIELPISQEQFENYFKIIEN